MNSFVKTLHLLKKTSKRLNRSGPHFAKFVLNLEKPRFFFLNSQTFILLLYVAYNIQN